MTRPKKESPNCHGRIKRSHALKEGAERGKGQAFDSHFGSVSFSVDINSGRDGGETGERRLGKTVRVYTYMGGEWSRRVGHVSTWLVRQAV